MFSFCLVAAKMSHKPKAREPAMTIESAQMPESTLTVDSQDDATISSLALSTSLGGRVRKTTQMFTFSQTKSDDPDVFSPPVGKGIKLREIEFIADNIEALGKKQVDMIKQLYNIMYGRRFQQKNVKVIKEHILDFSGIIEQDEKSREQLMAKMSKWKMAFVHEVMDLLAVDRSKKSFEEQGKSHNKETLLDRLADWLYNPQATKFAEKKAAIAAKKEKQKMNKRAKKIKATKKIDSEPAKKKRKTSKKKTVADSDQEKDELEVTESEDEESSSEFEEMKKPTKKRKIVKRPKKSPIVESDGEDDSQDEKMSDATADTDEKQSEDEKQPQSEKQPTSVEPTIAEESIAKKSATESKEPAVDARDSDKSSDKVGKSKGDANEEAKSNTKTLDADLCSKIRDIIAHGNAEELTVKKIVRQLNADLGRDFSAQKKAIKEFIQAEV
ncbi:protein dek [Plasmopara halstedii]|uniref:Protein dek n=1 Tax=Plasmopara halstedii TaxID=4781 RepID=A0A0P1ADL0_PLAHL|nr:protein dek [Plasmopara halstedii]CEG38889.1 protein dek [Plasmopara halstedii]|eukprot:XP_024575258.1 protein dek [Plasmopara halstedii]